MGISTTSTSRGRRHRFASVRGALHVGVIVALALSASLVVTGTAAAAGGKKTFTTTSVPAAIPDRIDGGGNLDSTIDVSGLTDTVTKVEIEMYVTGTNPPLDAALLAPSPSTLYSYLFTQFDLSGSNLGTSCSSVDQTRFDDAGSSSITTGSAPYVGTWQVSANTPGGPLPMSVFNGMSASDANGTWTLDFINQSQNALSIQCWSIYITTTADGRQEFDSFDVVSSPGAGDGVVDSTVNVSNVYGALTKVTVSLFIIHPNDEDLRIKLISPTGYEVPLVVGAGGNGNNFGSGCPNQMRTTFDSTSNKSLYFYNAPYQGTFKSQGASLQTLNGLTGSDVNGTWHLEIKDVQAGNVGTLNCWSLNLWSQALAIQPSMAPQPLPDTWSTAGFTVTNTTNDEIDDVTLTATLPKTLLLVQDLIDEGNKVYPNCTLIGRNLTCTWASIAAHTSAFGGVWAKVAHSLPSGKVCLSGSVVTPNSLPVTKSVCIGQRHYTTPDQGTGYAIGKIAHNLKLKDQNGNDVSLYQFRGSYVLLEISARWCPPSVFEVPHDRDAVKDLNDNDTMGVPVVYLQVLTDGATPGIQSTKTDATFWYNHFSLTSPVLYTKGVDPGHISDSMGGAVSMIGGQQQMVVPTSMFIRPDGTIFDLRIGAGPDEQDTINRFTNDLP